MIEEVNWFQINSPTVVCDVVHDEVVLVDLESGAYYSTEQVGTILWRYLNQGRNVGEIIAALSNHYVAETEEIEKNVYDLIGQLLSEGLIVEGSGTSPVAQNGSLPIFSQGQKEPYVGAVLHKFSDMEDLLLLDPVHEVDDIGWPHANKRQ